MTLFWSAKLYIEYQSEFRCFMQGMANRIAQGVCRYGQPDRRKKYLSRLEKETQTYRRTGNMEHLINIANYAYLESIAPENKKFHYDPTAPSATRVE